MCGRIFNDGFFKIYCCLSQWKNFDNQVSTLTFSHYLYKSLHLLCRSHNSSSPMSTSTLSVPCIHRHRLLEIIVRATSPPELCLSLLSPSLQVQLGIWRSAVCSPSGSSGGQRFFTLKLSVDHWHCCMILLAILVYLLSFTYFVVFYCVHF